MAFMRLIDRECNEAGCTKRATHEVLNTFNASIGVFCRTHAARRVMQQRRLEEDTYCQAGGGKHVEAKSKGRS